MMREKRPGERIAREFGHALGRMHARVGGDAQARDTLERWAQHAWAEADAGHVCVEVGEPADRVRLAASPVVGDAAKPQGAALVLDGTALYLHRLWQAECRLAQAIPALDSPAPLADASALDAAIRSVHGADPVDDAQQRALRRALGHRLTILSGGPGTGKTTTLARLLVAFAQLAPDARVAFAAPTGKAAARLAQSLSAQLVRLDPGGELRARLPDAGMTVHRLLGVRPDGSVGRGARHGSPLRLDHDLILVDEASMLDIELAAALASAIGPHARLVLAGDRDQLASVEAGAVFADLCASAGDAVVELTHNHRQKDAAHIVELAAQVRDASAARGDRSPRPIVWPARIALRAPDPAAIVDEALGAWAEVREAIDANATPAQVLAACDRHRVLTALREGPLGSDALNRSIAALARRRAASAAGERARRAQWYPGRIVLVTANRPALGLFNGDVGVCVRRPDASGDDALVVAFDGTIDARLFPVLQMPACEDAWAITVHKSQGSEFDAVSLVLAPRGHRLNTRELVYTGVTRARNRLVVWAERETVDEAAVTRTERRGRLAQRLAGRMPASADSPR